MRNDFGGKKLGKKERGSKGDQSIKRTKEGGSSRRRLRE